MSSRLSLKCPKCRQSDAIHFSSPRGLEPILGYFQITPYRCWNCYSRFYRFRRNQDSAIATQINQYAARRLHALEKTTGYAQVQVH